MICDCEEVIRLDPKNSNAYVGRGKAWHAKGAYARAISDYNEAIRLDLKQASAYVGRGKAWKAEGKADKAISDYVEAISNYNDAIWIDPTDARLYRDRGNAWEVKGEYEKAISDYAEAIRLAPKDASSWNGRAWLAATCSEAKYRDGKKAIDDATKACELTNQKNGDYVGTLAAAYAETGDFDSAVKWAVKAIDLAPEKLRGDYQSRLDLYKAHKPYRDEVKK